MIFEPKLQKVIQITWVGYGHSDGTTNAPNAIAKQLSTIFGGSQAAADNKIKITDSNDSAAGVYNSDNNNALAQESQGVENDILKSLLEQLLAAGRANQLTGYDVSSNTTIYAGPLPFEADDVIVIYVRPILSMSMNASVYTPSLISIPANSTTDATVNQLGVDSTTLFNNDDYEWVSKGGTLDGNTFTAGTAGTFSASGTNLVSPNATTALFDGHIWKISITLT